MKKFAKVMALTLIAVLSLALLISCAPNKDPAKATASLKEEGYTTVNLSGALSTGAVALLLGLKGEDVTNIVTGVKNDDEGNTQGVIAIYCKDAATAKSAMTKAKENLGKIEETLNIKFEGDTEVSRSGKIIYTGTDAGIKAAV